MSTYDPRDDASDEEKLDKYFGDGAVPDVSKSETGDSEVSESEEKKEAKKDERKQDVKNIASKAISGAAKGATTGGVWGAAAGALKSGGTALVKSKSGQKLLLILAVVASLPTVAFLVTVSLLSGAASVASYQNNADYAAGFSSAVEAEIPTEHITMFSRYGSQYGIPWEIFAAAYLIQKDSGGDGAGDFKITLDNGGNPTTSGKKLDYLVHDASEYQTSEADLKELEASTDYLARIIRDSFVGTVNDLPYNSLTIGSRLVNSSDSEKPHREIDTKDKDAAAHADQIAKVYTKAIERLPLGNIDNNGKIIFEKARLLAMGQPFGAMCNVLPVASGKWGNPFVSPTTSGFGGRVDPISGVSTLHAGQDFAGPPEGTPFYSASDGVVVYAYGTGGPEGNGDGGHGIVVDAGGGVELWYWHAAEGTTKVRKGDKVRTGQPLAGVGTTGYSTGVHLHFQIMENGVAVDPNKFMAARGVKLGVDPIGKTGDANTGSEEPLDTELVADTEETEDSGTNWSASESIVATDGDGNKITLNTKQLKYAETIISVGRNLGVDDKGLVVALITALQESTLKMYSNIGAYPESADYPHDADGSDHDSVGLFQQRPAAGWGSVAELMDAADSAKRFYGGPKGPNRGSPAGLLDVLETRNLSSATPGEVAQAVQVSAFPDAYQKWVPVAQKILSTVSGTSTPDSCMTEGTKDGSGDVTTGLDFEGDVSEAREKIIASAKKGLGGKYVWGGTDFKAWDCSGYFLWAYRDAGIEGVPRTNQWSAGKETTSPQPGDLVVMLATKHDKNGEAIDWSHVGIYAGKQNGEHMFYNALNPAQGTALNKVSEVGTDAQYFNLLDG